MEISNPTRIFCLSWPDSSVLTLLQKLTGSAPTPNYVENELPEPLGETAAKASSNAEPTRSTYPSIAGLSHQISLRTKYYNADITIWLDELPSRVPTLDSIPAWKEGFSQPGAAEVVRAVGAWVLVLRPDTDPSIVEGLLQAVKSVIADAHDGDSDNWEGACIAVSMPSGLVGKTSVQDVEHWEDICFEYGFEYIDGSASSQAPSPSAGLIEGVGREKVGIARIKEALEANDWAAPETEYLDFLVDEDADGSPRVAHEFGDSMESAGFAKERIEMEQEFAGLKMAIQGHDETENGEDQDDEEVQVEQLESIMRQIQMVKDMSAHMSSGEKKRFAAKAVNDMMKSI